MYKNEFRDKVLRTETHSTVTFDLRPFGDRQAEAIDCFLHDAGMAVQMKRFRPTKAIILVCDPGTVFSAATDMWLANMQSRGVAIAIQSECIAANVE